MGTLYKGSKKPSVCILFVAIIRLSPFSRSDRSDRSGEAILKFFYLATTAFLESHVLEGAFCLQAERNVAFSVMSLSFFVIPY